MLFCCWLVVLFFFCFNTGFSRKLFWVVFAFTSFTEPSKRVGNLIKKQSFKGNSVVRCNRTRRVLTAVELQWINKYSLRCSCCRQEKIRTKSASVQVVDNPTALGVNLCCSVCKSCYPELCQSYLWDLMGCLKAKDECWNCWFNCAMRCNTSETSKEV